MGNKMLALRLRSSSAWFASPLVSSLLPYFFELAEKLSPDFSVVRNKTKHTRNRQIDKITRDAGYPGPEFPPKKKRIPVHPLFKVVAPFIPTGVELFVFFTNVFVLACLPLGLI